MGLVAARCTNCGAPLQVDNSKEAAICAFCGTPFIVEKAIQNVQVTNHIQADVVQIVGTPATEADKRVEALQEMTSMINHFKRKEAEYGELEAVTDEIVRRNRGVVKTPLVIGILLTVVGIVGLLYPKGGGQISPFIFFLLIPGSLLIGLYVLLVVRNQKRLEWLSKRRNELIEILFAHYDAYPNCPLGFEYTHPEDLRELFDILRKGRATSVKEALNLFLEGK